MPIVGRLFSRLQQVEIFAWYVDKEHKLCPDCYIFIPVYHVSLRWQTNKPNSATGRMLLCVYYIIFDYIIWLHVRYDWFLFPSKLLLSRAALFRQYLTTGCRELDQYSMNELIEIKLTSLGLINFLLPRWLKSWNHSWFVTNEINRVLSREFIVTLVCFCCP